MMAVVLIWFDIWFDQANGAERIRISAPLLFLAEKYLLVQASERGLNAYRCFEFQRPSQVSVSRR